MMTMTAPLEWADMVLRLVLTVMAGILLGYNRSEHGKAAGMRTTLLVCLAASSNASGEPLASNVGPAARFVCYERPDPTTPRHPHRSGFYWWRRYSEAGRHGCRRHYGSDAVAGDCYRTVPWGRPVSIGRRRDTAWALDIMGPEVSGRWVTSRTDGTHCGRGRCRGSRRDRDPRAASG